MILTPYKYPLSERGWHAGLSPSAKQNLNKQIINDLNILVMCQQHVLRLTRCLYSSVEEVQDCSRN